MSIVKDFCLILMFLFLVVGYILLYRNMVKQREYFVSTLSHDLRVATIAQIRALELLKKNLLQVDFAKELILEIDNSCKFTLEMMTMLLNTYRFESGNLVLNRNQLPIVNLIKNVSEKLSNDMRKKNLKLESKVQGDTLAYVDANEISKVIFLLLTTVIINAQNDSIIEIFVSSDNRECKVDIVYEGLPLTEEERRRMFSQSPKFSIVGHGIKMHLCKKIIDFHRGKIFVKNIDKTRNSFSFELPRYRKTVGLKSVLISNLQPNNL